jgi:peroxiredoxin
MNTNHILTAIAATIAISVSAYSAEIGKPAPDFSAKSVKGVEVSLASLKGKVVVLEWSSYACPFVKKHYDSKNMQKIQEAYTAKDVVWITINSSSPKSRGYYFDHEAFLKKAEENGSKATHLIVDDSGAVGKLYSAKVTPHIFVINKDGVLVYNGAIDSKASMNPKDIASAENYVATALDAVLAGKAVATAKTQPYGCGVKY